MPTSISWGILRHLEKTSLPSTATHHLCSACAPTRAKRRFLAGTILLVSDDSDEPTLLLRFSTAPSSRERSNPTALWRKITR
jgi:hypothetical protein